MSGSMHGRDTYSVPFGIMCLGATTLAGGLFGLILGLVVIPENVSEYEFEQLMSTYKTIGAGVGFVGAALHEGYRYSKIR